MFRGLSLYEQRFWCSTLLLLLFYILLLILLLLCHYFSSVMSMLSNLHSSNQIYAILRESSDEFVWRCKDKGQSLARVVQGVWGESWCAPGICISPLLFAIVVISENGLMCKMLYADDLVLTSETMEGPREKFWKWKEAFESRGWRWTSGRQKWY